MNEPSDGLACKKDGFFVAGFETPGQYSKLRGQYIPLSRAICCRPCLSPGDSTLPGVGGNVTADDVVAISSDCQASAKPSRGSSVGGQTCPADSFVQGFARDVRANPASAPDDRYYYPTGKAQCCSPRLLLRDGNELPVERCLCTEQSAAYAVGCGAANTPDSAQSSGSLLYAFDNAVSAVGAYGETIEVPVTPVRCCKLCVSPNAKPAMDDCSALNFCNGNGDCTVDGHCQCKDGWMGASCETQGGDEGTVHDWVTNGMKIVIGVILGCCFGRPIMRCLGLEPRRRPAGDLEEELLPSQAQNDWEFEASDLSTSDDGEGDETDDDATESEEEHGDDGVRQSDEDAEAEEDAPAEEGAEADEDAEAGVAAEAEGVEISEADAERPDETDGEETSGEVTKEGKPDPSLGDVELKETTSPSNDEEGKVEKNRSTAECTVCMSARVQVVLVPCGHACLCRKCSRRMRLCPICRTEVQKRQKLYIAM